MSRAEAEPLVTDHSVAQRIARYSAPAVAILWIGGILLATLLFPSFDWTQDTLAEVGRAGQATAPILDGSLFAGSLLGVWFLWVIAKQRGQTSVLQRAGLLLMGLMVFLVGFGQLGIPQPYLLVIVLSIVWFLPLTFAVYGTGEVLSGNDRLGLLSFWFGIVHLLAWQIISNFLSFSSAIPAFITTILLAVWILAHYREFMTSDG